MPGDEPNFPFLSFPYPNDTPPLSTAERQSLGNAGDDAGDEMAAMENCAERIASARRDSHRVLAKSRPSSPGADELHIAQRSCDSGVN